MHAFFHTRAAQRRSTWAAEARIRKPAPACLMQMTVEAGSVTALRQMAMRICGDTMEFMRIEACDHGARMRVCLCIGPSKMVQVMEAVMRLLPGAEFGPCAEFANPALALCRALPHREAQ